MLIKKTELIFLPRTHFLYTLSIFNDKIIVGLFQKPLILWFAISEDHFKWWRFQETDLEICSRIQKL